MLKFIVLVLSVAAAPAFASQSSPTPDTRPRFGVQRPPQADPYKKLFEWQTKRAQQALDSKLVETKQTVVCGMTIVAADPKIDPKMVFARPSDGVDYKIRAIDPPICNPAR